jgi:hypothetical protein
MYTLATILSFLAIMFLNGPIAHLKHMIAPDRRLQTGAFFFSMFFSKDSYQGQQTLLITLLYL